jgi:hypothetical protein
MLRTVVTFLIKFWFAGCGGVKIFGHYRWFFFCQPMLYYLLVNALFLRDLPFLAAKLIFVSYITLCIHDLMYNVIIITNDYFNCTSHHRQNRWGGHSTSSRGIRVWVLKGSYVVNKRETSKFSSARSSSVLLLKVEQSNAAWGHSSGELWATLVRLVDWLKAINESEWLIEEDKPDTGERCCSEAAVDWEQEQEEKSWDAGVQSEQVDISSTPEKAIIRGKDRGRKNWAAASLWLWFSCSCCSLANLYERRKHWRLSISCLNLSSKGTRKMSLEEWWTICGSSEKATYAASIWVFKW